MRPHTMVLEVLGALSGAQVAVLLLSAIQSVPFWLHASQDPLMIQDASCVGGLGSCQP